MHLWGGGGRESGQLLCFEKLMVILGTSESSKGLFFVKRTNPHVQ